MAFGMLRATRLIDSLISNVALVMVKFVHVGRADSIVFDPQLALRRSLL